MKKKDVFVSTIKGLITGVASWINNMSIASLILSVSSYSNVINGLSNIKKKKNDDLLYVTIPLLLGICIGLLAGHQLIDFLLNKCQLQIIILFIGLFLGGIKVLFDKHKLNLNKKNLYIPIIIITFGLFIAFLSDKCFTISNYILNSIVMGLLTSAAILIPGISFFVSKLDNNYDFIVNALTNISSFKNFIIVFIFLIVLVINLIIVAKIIKYLLDKSNNNTYIALCSCVILSIVFLATDIKPVNINFVNIFTSILAFLWGYIFAKNVERE